MTANKSVLITSRVIIAVSYLICKMLIHSKEVQYVWQVSISVSCTITTTENYRVVYIISCV